MSQQRFANVNDVPLALAVWLANDTYDHSSDPNEISVTTLLKPIRQVILATRIPPGEGLVDLGDMVNSRMGTAIHNGIESSWKYHHESAMRALGIPDKVIEMVRINPTPATLASAKIEGRDIIPIYVEPDRFKRSLMTHKGRVWTVTGKCDFIGDGRVQDFKSTSVYTYQKQTNTDKYSLQGSQYRWLEPEKITQSEMEIHFIFTDWKANMAKTDPTYPNKRYVTQRIPLLSLMETEQFIVRKLMAIDQYMDADEADIPFCTDEELWRSEPVFKYYKNGDITSKRSTKNFDTRQDALIFMGSNGNAGAIKEVPGQVTACKYCPAFSACSQKDYLIKSGDLQLT